MGVFLNYNTANEKTIKKELVQQFNTTGALDMTKLLKPSVFSTQFYKNRNIDQVISAAKLGQVYFSYTKPAVPFTWEITQETKEFLGYQVQKATTSFAGRDYEAWFTFEIPISDGPYVFYGLPGLIVELYDTQKHYVFEMKSIQKLEEEAQWMLPDAKSVTKTEYLVNQAKYAKAALKSSGLETRIANAGGTIVKMTTADGKVLTEADLKRERREKASKRNNPIELY